jgi:hypothetical protein
MNKLKIGIDIHGVIDLKPAFFRTFIDRARANGHEIHIITGGQKKPKLLNQLKDLGINYDYFFSVSDFLIEQGVPVHFEDSNNPWFDIDQWNKIKSMYCAKQEINIHIDDSDQYGKYFITPYMQLKG